MPSHCLQAPNGVAFARLHNKSCRNGLSGFRWPYFTAALQNLGPANSSCCPHVFNRATLVRLLTNNHRNGLLELCRLYFAVALQNLGLAGPSCHLQVLNLAALARLCTQIIGMSRRSSAGCISRRNCESLAWPAQHTVCQCKMEGT